MRMRTEEDLEALEIHLERGLAGAADVVGGKPGGHGIPIRCYKVRPSILTFPLFTSLILY